MTADVVHKIVTAAEWTKAQATGVVAPSAIDVRDGYMHLSDPAQTLDTADRYFADRQDIVALEIAARRIASGLHYELAPKRGALFPHLYGELKASDVTRARPLTRVAGAWRFADEV